MKLFASAAVAFFLLLAVHLSLQIPRLVDCPDDFLGKNPDLATECSNITCEASDDPTDEIYLMEPCFNVACDDNENSTIIEGDNSRAFPDCCDRLICSPETIV